MKKKRKINYFCIMYSISNLLDSIKGEDLDKMLEYGMFRNGKKIFTTNFLQFDNVIYSAIWLRIILEDFELTEKQKILFKKNSAFEIKYGIFKITEEKENLYEHYRSNTSFKGNITLDGLLNDYAENNVFDSKEICIYDNGKLIACGVYDAGKTTCAGIVSFFDGKYKKHSLGRYIILLKIIHSLKCGYKYFYPGYFAPGYSIFNYKLDFAKSCTEYLNIKYNVWLNVASEYDDNDIPIDRIKNNLKLLKKDLEKREIKSKLMLYHYFDSNIYINYGQYEPMTSPYIIMFKNKLFGNFIITYDLHKNAFVGYEIHGFEHNMALNNLPNTYDKLLLIISNLDQKEFLNSEEIAAYLKQK